MPQKRRGSNKFSKSKSRTRRSTSSRILNPAIEEWEPDKALSWSLVLDYLYDQKFSTTYNLVSVCWTLRLLKGDRKVRVNRTDARLSNASFFIELGVPEWKIPYYALWGGDFQCLEDYINTHNFWFSASFYEKIMVGLFRADSTQLYQKVTELFQGKSKWNFKATQNDLAIYGAVNLYQYLFSEDNNSSVLLLFFREVMRSNVSNHSITPHRKFIRFILSSCNSEDIMSEHWRWLGDHIVQYDDVELLETMFSKEGLGENTPFASRLLESAIRKNSKNILKYFRLHPPSEPLDLEQCRWSQKSTIREIAHWFDLSIAEIVDTFSIPRRQFLSFEVRVEILKSHKNPLTSSDVHHLLHSDDCNLEQISELLKTMEYEKWGPIRLVEEFTLEKLKWIRKHKLELSEFQYLPNLDIVKWYVRNYDTRDGIFYADSGEIENWLLKNRPDLVTLNRIFEDVENVDKKLYLNLINGPWGVNLSSNVHRAVLRGNFRYLLWLKSFVPAKTLKNAISGLEYRLSIQRIGVAYFLSKITKKPLVAFSKHWDPPKIELAEIEVLPTRDRKTITTMSFFKTARRLLSQPDFLKLQQLLPELKKIKLTSHRSNFGHACRLSGIKG